MVAGDQHWADSVAMMVAKHLVVSQTRPYERLHLMKLLGEHSLRASKRFKSKGESHVLHLLFTYFIWTNCIRTYIAVRNIL